MDEVDCNSLRNDGASKGAQRGPGVAGVQPGAVAGSGPGPMDPFGCPTRETWRELSQEHVQLADLGPAVQGTIHVIEDHGRDHLLPRVRTLCQVTPRPSPGVGSFLLPENLGRRRLPVSPWTCAQPSRAFAGVTGQGTDQVLISSWSGRLVRPPASRMPLSGAEGQGRLPPPPGLREGPCPCGWAGLGLASPPFLRSGSSSLRASPFVPSSFLHL